HIRRSGIDTNQIHVDGGQLAELRDPIGLTVCATVDDHLGHKGPYSPLERSVLHCRAFLGNDGLRSRERMELYQLGRAAGRGSGWRGTAEPARNFFADHDRVGLAAQSRFPEAAYRDSIDDEEPSATRF